MQRSKVLPGGLIAVLLIPFVATAEDTAQAAAPKPAIPSMDDVFNAWGITFTGHLDVAYSHASRTPTGRVFDTEKNSFNVHQAALTVAKQAKEGFGALVNVTAGEDASLLASNGLSSSSFDLTQAYIQYATGPLTVIGGKYVTLAGAEVIASPGNSNYTRSLLFGAVPFTHTGLRATYVVSDSLLFTVGVNNGWDQAKDTNAQKTLELGASVTAMQGLTIALSDYIGAENTSTTTHGTRNLFDVVANFAVSEVLNVGGEYLNYSQDNFISVVNGANIKGKYQGIAGYASLLFGDALKLSARAEWFDDKDGVRFGANDNTVTELTLTLGYLVSKNAEIRGEIRGDRASKPIYPDSLGNNGKSLTTFGVQALYKF